ncbi:MAG TPA: hypothetical protein VLA31_02090 [Burkholderiaceae bacterium]|nr:hypothetical protein [Burkholderiaceae bacterium]
MSDDWNKLKHLVDLSAENARLKAENERLRKAGDAMLPFFVYPPYEKGSHNAVLNWLAAKEGKQP